MASFGALELMEEVESDGEGRLQLISLMDGVDQSPVVPQPLIPEHPVHHRPGRVPVGPLLQDPDPAGLNWRYRGRHWVELSARPAESRFELNEKGMAES